MESFVVQEGHVALRTHDGVLFSQNTLLQYPIAKKDTIWHVPDGTTSIFQSAFDQSLYLEEITVPGSVTTIDNSAFKDSCSLRKVILSEGLDTIGVGAFMGCSALAEINLPDSLISIKIMAFDGCTSLTELTIPANVKSIGGRPLVSIPSHVKVTIDEENLFFQMIDGILYDNPVTTIIQVFDYVKEEVIIQEGITNIPVFSFRTLDHIREITLPDCVTTIGEGAFFECAGLNSITIPNSVTSIGDRAFHDCSNLTKITFAGNAPSFGPSVFIDVTATAYYPADNDTWTSDVMQDYSGTITWVATCSSEHYYETVVTYPTCTERGYTTHTCSVCGDSYADSYVEATGHSLVRHTAQLPTCTAHGWEAYDTCENCDYTTYVEIAASGHSLVRHTAQLPTCTAHGWKAYDTCENCDYTTYIEIAASGHSFTDYISDSNATHDADGTKTATCDNGCGATDTVTDIGSKLSPAIVTSEKYTISDGYISKLTAGTTVADMVAGINEKQYIKVFSGDKEVTGNALVGTGMRSEERRVGKEC